MEASEHPDVSSIRAGLDPPIRRDPDLSFEWIGFLARLIHPLKVAILEAHLYLQTPLSSRDLSKVLDRELQLSTVSYHVTALSKSGVLVKVRTRNVRGSVETFYRLR